MSATLLGGASICLSSLFWAISNCSSWGPCGKINSTLPNSVADIAVYILTGILPIEAQMHIRAFGLFNNVCRQAEDSLVILSTHFL
jgi:hypothetical protein